MICIREVLFPTDLSPESDRAFDHARLLTERFQASLTLYHAVQVPDRRFAHWAFDHDHEIWEQAEKEARRCLHRRAEILSVSHQVVVERTVSVPRGLLALIRKTQPDLTVLATHGREGLSHLLLGSVAETIMQHAFRPVLCVREPDHAAALPYRRILVPTDLSLASRLAFPIASLFARTFGAEILGLHVVPSPSRITLSGIPPENGAEIASESSLWKFFQSDFGDLEVTALVHAGSPWDRIVQTAREEKADLIVMATRGHDSLADRVVGSNTERVVRHAPCPVLVS
jgi:nucleotide-binding universal stress UspA family protein